MSTIQEIAIGTRIHSILYGGREGTIVRIHGEAQPETIITFPGLTTGGNAEYDIVWDNLARSLRIPECIIRGVQWRLLDEEPMAPETIPALIHMAEQEAQRKLDAEAEKKTAMELSRQRLIQEHPELQEGDGNAAKNIRIQLKREFPGFKFSVRSDHNSVRISWDEGPTTDQVEAITSRYKAGRFDGMSDCYEYNQDRVWPFGSVSYIFTNRHWTIETRSTLVAAAESRFATPDPYEHQRHANQAFARTSLPKGARVTGIHLPEGHHEYLAKFEIDSAPSKK